MPTPFMFGSFGDVVAVLQLAWQLRMALDEAAGASAEIQSLIADVDVFISALHDIHAFVERHRTTLRPDVRNGLCAALARCCDTLRPIVQKLRRAEARASGSTWHKHLGRAAWSVLGTKKDVDALRQHLAEQVDVVQLYLGLSQVQDQNAVALHLAEQGTTLERICGVLQDIQVRFDVGVPSFRFFDRRSGRYCPPLARTSLQRLNEVVTAADCQDIMNYVATRYHAPGAQVLNRVQGKRTIKFSYPIIKFHCLFFKDSAFGLWQALIYTGPRVGDGDRLFKHLLERGHAIGEACNCAAQSCAAIHRHHVQQKRDLDDMMKLYSDVAQMHLRRLCEATLEYDSEELHSAIVKAFARLPSLDTVRSIAANEGLRSADSILELLVAARSGYAGKAQEIGVAISPMRLYVRLWIPNVHPALLSLLVEPSKKVTQQRSML